MNLESIAVTIEVLNERIREIENARNCAADYATHCELVEAFKDELAILQFALGYMIKRQTRLQEELKKEQEDKPPFE